jgi:hypothetical protein
MKNDMKQASNHLTKIVDAKEQTARNLINQARHLESQANSPIISS